MPKGSIEGTLVSVVGREFQPFVNKDGETVQGGTAYKAWISSGFDQAPTSAKCSAAVAAALMAAGPGATVKAETWLRAKGDRIEQQLDADSLAVFPS